jgi:hypothetical protein
MDGFLQAAIPALQGDVAKLEVRTLRLEAEIAKRPTTMLLIAIVAIMIAIDGLPYWGHWLADMKAILGTRP